MVYPTKLVCVALAFSSTPRNIVINTQQYSHNERNYYHPVIAGNNETGTKTNCPRCISDETFFNTNKGQFISCQRDHNIYVKVIRLSFQCRLSNHSVESVMNMVLFDRSGFIIETNTCFRIRIWRIAAWFKNWVIYSTQKDRHFT